MNKLFESHGKSNPNLWPILCRVNHEIHQNKTLKKILFRQEIRSIRDDIEQKRGQDALSILPNEMWSEIIQFVFNGSDQWSCCKACTLFRDLIGQPLDGLLFTKTFPLLFIHLKNSSVLKCRLISKSWRRGVDEFLEGYALQCNNKNNLYTHRFSLDPDLQQEWKAHESRLHNCISNPLVGRSVNLVLKLHTPEIEFDAIISFLETWGKNIVSLNVEGPIRFLTAENASFLLSQILLHCPKLRKLVVTGIYVPITFDDCQPSSTVANLLPDHNNLVQLRIKNADFTHGYILKRYSNQLTALYINDWRDNLNYNHVGFQNLQILALECSTFPVRELQKIKASCLRELSLPKNNDTLSMSSLANILRQFPSLKSLKLRLGTESLLLPEEEIRTLLFMSNNQWICFHSIQNLELRIPDLEAQKNFDFLIFFPGIETLRICLETMTAMDVPDLYTSRFREELLFDLYESLVCNSKDVYQCNIWKLLLKLNKIELLLTFGRSTKMEKYCYTRSGYEYIHSEFRSFFTRVIYTGVTMCLVLIVLALVDPF